MGAFSPRAIIHGRPVEGFKPPRKRLELWQTFATISKIGTQIPNPAVPGNGCGDDDKTNNGNLAPFFVGINAHFWPRSHHINSYIRDYIPFLPERAMSELGRPGFSPPSRKEGR
jgi:hypothetical protein